MLLPELGWYRLDARGNNAHVSADFTPPVECLAFPIKLEGEADLPEIWTDPIEPVVTALRSSSNCQELLNQLPDFPIIG